MKDGFAYRPEHGDWNIDLTNEAEAQGGVSGESEGSPRPALLPCPFCGSAPCVETDSKFEDVGCFNVACLVQPRALGIADCPARRTWNTRTSAVSGDNDVSTKSSIQPEMKCLQCGTPISPYCENCQPHPLESSLQP